MTKAFQCNKCEKFYTGEECTVEIKLPNYDELRGDFCAECKEDVKKTFNLKKFSGWVGI